MIRLLKWLIGYTVLRFYDGFSEGFLNACYKNKYNIQHITRRGNDLILEAPRGLAAILSPLAEQHGGTLEVVAERGLPYRLAKIKNRWGIFFGIVAGIMFINYVLGFVWSINVVGNETLTDSEVKAFLRDNGFYEGVSWRGLDKDGLENLMLASYDECAWVHINRHGTHADVELREAVKKPRLVKKKRYTNLKAKKSGIIVKAYVNDGWAKVSKGDAVTKGDLLISGVYTGEKGVNLYTHAYGEYLARVKEPVSLTVSRTQSEKEYICTAQYKRLAFFGLKIPLFFGKEPQAHCERSVKAHFLTLNGKALPIGMITDTVRTYAIKKRTLSDRELTALMKKEIRKKLKEDFSSYEIIQKKINISLDEAQATATGYVMCIENIGKEVRIKIR